MNYEILSRFSRLTVVYGVVKMTPTFMLLVGSEINNYYGYLYNVLLKSPITSENI